jgi:hypothetical protein
VQREEGRDSSSWNSSLSEDVREEEYEEWQKKPLEEPKKKVFERKGMSTVSARSSRILRKKKSTGFASSCCWN